MKLRLAQSFCFILWCSSALTAQTTKAIDVELHNVSLAEALKDLEDKSGTHILFDYKDIEPYHVTCHAEDQPFERSYMQYWQKSRSSAKRCVRTRMSFRNPLPFPKSKKQTTYCPDW